MQDYILPHSQEKTETRKEGSGATTGIGCRHGHAITRASLVVSPASYCRLYLVSFPPNIAFVPGITGTPRKMSIHS